MATAKKSAKKANSPAKQTAGRKDSLLKRTGPPSDIRFEATLGPTPYRKALSMAADMDLDRLPDVDGQVRLLLTPDDARRLLDMGVPVHLEKAHPVRPLPRERLMSDQQAQSSLEERLKGLPRQGGR
jgi:hypothetical protein